MEMTLAEAATAVKMTKQGLLNAINKGRLSASKDANGQWKVDSAELVRVYPAAKPVTPSQSTILTIGDAALATEFAVMKAKLEAAEARADELRRERDQWQRQAEQLLLALPASLAQHQQRPQAEAPPQPMAPEPMAEPAQAAPQAQERPVVASEPDEWIEVPDDLEKPKKRGWLARWFGGGDDGK